MYGDKAFITRDEAVKIEEQEKALMAAANRESDPNRTAPPDGGDGSEGASGNVGGYNAFWIDRGSAAFEIDGKFATSIIVDPSNGQFPPMTPAAMERAAAQRAQFRENKGDAWWLTEQGPGPTTTWRRAAWASAASSASARRAARRCCRCSTTT